MGLERRRCPLVVIGFGGSTDRSSPVLLCFGAGTADKLGADKFEVDTLAAQLHGKRSLGQGGSFIDGHADDVSCSLCGTGGFTRCVFGLIGGVTRLSDTQNQIASKLSGAFQSRFGFGGTVLGPP